MYYFWRSYPLHIDLSVKRIIEKFIIYEIYRIFLTGGKGISNTSYRRDSLTANNFSPEISNCVLLIRKTGLGRFPHWSLTFHINTRYWLILILNWSRLPRCERTNNPFNTNGMIRGWLGFNGSLTMMACVLSYISSDKRLEVHRYWLLLTELASETLSYLLVLENERPDGTPAYKITHWLDDNMLWPWR